MQLPGLSQDPSALKALDCQAVLHLLSMSNMLLVSSSTPAPSHLIDPIYFNSSTVDIAFLLILIAFKTTLTLVHEC